MKDNAITVTFSEKELDIIRNVFHDLTSKRLEKWTQLIPKEGNQRSGECDEQWRAAGVYNEIRHKAAVALGLEEDITDEDVEKILEEYNFPRKP